MKITTTGQSSCANMPTATTILLCLLAILALGCAQEQRGNATSLEERFFLTNYGNWCGHNHGGFQDCCGGGPCPACVAGLQVEPMVITSDCIRQCPFADLLDQACSRHDLCTYEYDIGTQACGNPCYCDCRLVREWSHISCARSPSWLHCDPYKQLGTTYFTNIASCFYLTNDDQLMCDALGSGIPLDRFC